MGSPMTTPGSLANLVSADEVVTAQQKEIAALKQKNAELAAQLIKARDAVRANHNWHNDNDEYGEYLESELYDQNMAALSITGTEALAEVKASTLEEASSTMVNTQCNHTWASNWLNDLAASIRKGE